MRPRPINDAEAVIEAFWDETLSDLDAYTVEPGEGPGATVSQYWCWVESSWHAAVPGAPIFTMSREVDIPIEGYDALRIRCAVPSSARLVFKEYEAAIAEKEESSGVGVRVARPGEDVAFVDDETDLGGAQGLNLHGQG